LERSRSWHLVGVDHSQHALYDDIGEALDVVVKFGIAVIIVPQNDFLQQVIDNARPQVADQGATTKERVQVLWAYCKHSRDLAAANVLRDAFMALAIEAKLIGADGWWLPTDGRASIRRHGREDIEHVISWALLGQNPFETGPLQ
jgi:hypothetical protein